MVWLGGMVCMAGLLKDHGFIAWFAETMKEEVTGMGALATALTLALIYFYSMYGFSMLTGHITAMVAAFLARRHGRGSRDVDGCLAGLFFKPAVA